MHALPHDDDSRSEALSQQCTGLSMDASTVEDLLAEFQIWYELDRKAKQRYQAQLAPDFRLIKYLQRDENALSTYLSLLLDPHGQHGQGDLYLGKFLALLPEKTFQPTAADHLGSHTEFRLPSNRRLDVYLRFRTGGIAIENKPWAVDQEEQIHDYAKYLDSQYPEGNWILIYLSNGDISDHSLPKCSPVHLTDRVVSLDFFSLAGWLDECAVLTRAMSVRLFIETVAQFIREQINGDFQLDNGHELTELMLRNKKNLRGAFYIAQHLHEVKRKLWRNFADHLDSKLAALGAELVFEEELMDGTPHSVIGVRLSPTDRCGLSWAFNRRNHEELYFGIRVFSEDDTKKINSGKIRREMDNLCDVPGRTTSWWPWWTFDSRAFTSHPIPKNWANNPDAWLALQDRSDEGFATQIIEMVKCMQSNFDLSLLKGR